MEFLLPLLFVFGASVGSITPLNVVYGNCLLPNRAGVVGAFLMGLVWCVAEGLGQFGGGMLTKLFTDDAPAHALGCLGILFFVGLAVYVRLPRELPAQTEDLSPSVN
jgi:FSR family fosmidomycin resistance protein-like MFS transporter